ncbi:diguanylate cyclase (GGDEF)-like protein [Bacillus mesophilus]|uniref:GGDEF domain-containing protein n=1 Tax=Bacillus mesophilus TaxID=1808955 RepID=A0A6M0Q9T7_9BACI|nr:GGDEF domain-containing protein [Bacillus mesophilus]MBM7662291.1 diguanylate cyclase (GGDEF)-like protein [Bacillus mesophilus]NEY73075.1 GGDEF domain-containing protein [Bacillus mesophilus]
MKFIIKDAYHSDHALEVIFSSLRWFFIVLSISVFTVQYIENPVNLKLYFFISLVVFGVLYMGISDYYLHKSPEGSRMYTLMTKCGPFFDFIAFSALIPLTGGIESPLFPLAYLILLHIAVYWRVKGGVIAAFLFILIYSIIFMIQVSTSHSLINYFSQVFFLLLIGGLGGIIVSRERKHHSEKNLLVEVANRDYLTNLLNHRSFQECLRKDLDNGKDFYLALTDIDKFKSINDQYGHVMGDKVLRQIGSIFTSIIPVKQGKVFRYGGEEFAIILYSNEQFEVNKLLVEVKQAVAMQTFYCEGQEFSITMSFGSCKQNGETPDQLVEKVDRLLYEAKDRGRDQIVYSNVG